MTRVPPGRAGAHEGGERGVAPEQARRTISYVKPRLLSLRRHPRGPVMYRKGSAVVLLADLPGIAAGTVGRAAYTYRVGDTRVNRRLRVLFGTVVVYLAPCDVRATP